RSAVRPPAVRPSAPAARKRFIGPECAPILEQTVAACREIQNLRIRIHVAKHAHDDRHRHLARGVSRAERSASPVRSEPEFPISLWYSMCRICDKREERL